MFSLPLPLLRSGPLSRSGAVGFAGTILHVGAWVAAFIVDIIVLAAIDQENSPGAFTYAVAGFIALAIGLVVLLAVTTWHFFASDDDKIPEGGAPPFLMTLFIGGAQISLLLTLLQMIASMGQPGTDFYNYPNGTITAEEQKDYRDGQRVLMVLSMIAKVYVVQFLRNNQEWAGPAAELKTQAAGPKTTTA